MMGTFNSTMKKMLLKQVIVLMEKWLEDKILKLISKELQTVLNFQFNNVPDLLLHQFILQEAMKMKEAFMLLI